MHCIPSLSEPIQPRDDKKPASVIHGSPDHVIYGSLGHQVTRSCNPQVTKFVVDGRVATASSIPAPAGL